MGKKTYSVQDLIKLMAEKQRWLKRHYREHGEILKGVDATRVEALRRIETRLRTMRQKTISEAKAKKLVSAVVFEEMHLMKSPFKEL